MFKETLVLILVPRSLSGTLSLPKCLSKGVGARSFLSEKNYSTDCDRFRNTLMHIIAKLRGIIRMPA